MKRIIAFLLSIALLLSGCAQIQHSTELNNTTSASDQTTPGDLMWVNTVPEYGTLDNPKLLGHIEDLVYMETVTALNSEEYVVENVSAVYISKEYLEELAFNSQENIYFGYKLTELDALFQGTRYIFTLGNDGQTTVQELQEIKDTTSEDIIKDVAIGVGVILVCVTVSAVTAGAGAPAVSLIFAASAKTATTMALSSAAFGGISAGVVKGIETGDMNQALKAAALASAEGFKWGAISGAIIGGGKEAFLLKSATRNGLTMNEVAIIQQESGLPADVISQMHSMSEYNVYKQAGLKSVMVNGKTALVQNIDLNHVSQLPDGSEVTNLVRMQRGYAPIEPATGKAYQLHHIGQKADGTLAILTESQHQGNSAILNIVGKESEIDRKAFNATRKAFWEYLGNVVFATGG